MKNRHRAMIVLFLILTIGPSVLWFFLKPADYNATIDLTENRTLAQAPTFDIHTIRQFPAQFDSYYSDHLPFRTNLIELFAALEYKLFGESINSSVIVGKDGWLFYSNPADGSSINSYKGTDHFSQEQMQTIADNLTGLRDRIEETGSEFVVMFPPNKESVYPEHLPRSVKRISELNRLDLLVDFLKDNTDLRVVYPKDALNEQKENYQVYYKQDTHWNSLGGYIGSAALLDELGMNLKPFNELLITEKNSDAFDLRNMGRLNLAIEKEADYRVQGFSDYTSFVDELESDSFIRLKSDNLNGKKLVILRDSFATAMLEYLPSFFEESVFIHWRAYDSELIAHEEPDVYVLELVERSLPILLSYAF